jgi:putative copper resistance protein D
MIFAVLAATRFAHFAAIGLLFGLASFPFYGACAADANHRLVRSLKICAILSVVTLLLELDAMAANMGGSPGSAFDPQILRAGLTGTVIGQIGLARLGLALAIMVFALRLQSGKKVWLVGASAALLASVALTGHSSIPGGAIGVVHEIADAIHLLAAGWWIGGLCALVLMARSLGGQIAVVLARFSRIGYAAVLAIVATGVFKSVPVLGSFSALTRTAYGWVLLLKVALFGLMGALALSNRLQITPALEQGKDRSRWMGRLALQVSVEFGLSLAVLLVVGVLGAMQPPVSQ